MQTDEDTTVAIVGLGEIGRLYAEIAQDLGCTVVGADANVQLREGFERRTDAETYEDFHAVFDMDVDFALVTVPNKFKETVGVAAIEAGLDVYFEKPLAHTADSAERILDAAAGSDVICMVGYYFPFFSPSECLRRHLVDGNLGEITHVEACFTQRRHVPNRGSWYTSKDIAGGGVLQDKGSFVLNMLRYFGFGELESASAVTRSEFDERDEYVYLEMWGGEGHENVIDVEDSATAFLEFEDGRTATVDVAWAINSEPRHTYRLRGPEGGALLDINEPALVLYDAYQGPPPHLAETHLDAGVDAEYVSDGDLSDPLVQRDQLAHYLECLSDREQPDRCSLEDAVRVQRMIEQIYAAAS